MVQSASHPDALVDMLTCLADATRLRLLRLLEQHELGVAELCDVLQMPQSTVSRHLKLLGDRNWVVARRQGTTNLYRTILDELAAAPRQLWITTREELAGSAAFKQDQLRLARLLSERRTDAQAFFANAADQWDKLREELYGRSFVLAAAMAVSPRDLIVADLGCGTASFVTELAPHARRVIGVDNSPAMLQAAAARTEGLPNVELRQGDLEQLPLEDRSVDAAMMLLVLTYLTDPRKAVAEMARVLRPGGRAIVVDLLRHDRDDFRRQMGQSSLGFDPPDLEKLLGATGLTHVACRALPPEPQAKGPALFLATADKPN